jgi:hypothetical protein
MSRWRERDHPRDDRGRFAPKQGDWAARVEQTMFAGDSDVERFRHLTQTAHQVSARKLVGGTSATTRVRTLVDEDGRKRRVVTKRETPEYAQMEIESSKFLRLIGAPAPIVVGDDIHSGVVHMEYVPGKTLYEAVWRQDGRWRYDPKGYDEEIEDLALAELRRLGDSDEGRLLGLFDVLYGYGDRHSANVLRTRGGIVGIDHTHIGHWDDSLASPLITHYIDAKGWRDNPLTPQDVAWLRPRFKKLLKENQSFSRDDRRHAMLRFEELAKRARGTRSLIVGRTA